MTTFQLQPLLSAKGVACETKAHQRGLLPPLNEALQLGLQMNRPDIVCVISLIYG